jgi:hypothetical protein
MNEQNLARVEKGTMAVATAEQSPFQATMALITSAARDASIDVNKMERLLDMAFKMEARDAEKQFIFAFNQLQSELPTIVASTVINNRGKYERFEDVMHQIKDPLQKNGFTVSFNAKILDGNPPRMEETCTLSHIAGHSRANSFTVRISGKADSETQADCKAATTAKRNALLNALNIVIRQDVLTDEADAGMESGDKITRAKADEICKRVLALKMNEQDFLCWAGAKTYFEISTSRAEEIDGLLTRREQKAANDGKGKQ